MGQLSRHPLDLFEDSGGLRAQSDQTFTDSMSRAWDAAKKLVGQEVAQRRGVRWRLLRADNGQPVAATGKSASGAAARGLWFVLQRNPSDGPRPGTATGRGRREVPDEGVIVLAQVSPSDLQKIVGLGGSTAHIGEKVAAVVEFNAGIVPPREPIDTIVVAALDDYDEAQNTLLSLKAESAVRVVLLDGSRDAMDEAAGSR